MWTYNNTDDLYHYGVIGMRWGRRRSKSQLARARAKAEKNSVKNMSDEELRKRVNRLQLEKQYSQLSPSKVTKGKRAVGNVIKATTTVAALTTTGITLYNNAGKIKSIAKKAKM